MANIPFIRRPFKNPPPKRKRRAGAGRPVLTDTVRMVISRRDPGIVRIVISEDIVERLYQLREGNPKAKIDDYARMTLRAEFRTFQDASMPAALLRVEQLTFTPRGSVLRQVGRTYHTQQHAAKLGIFDGVASQKLETMWADHMRGVVIVFKDDDFNYLREHPEARKTDKEDKDVDA